MLSIGITHHFSRTRHINLSRHKRGRFLLVIFLGQAIPTGFTTPYFRLGMTLGRLNSEILDQYNCTWCSFIVIFHVIFQRVLEGTQKNDPKSRPSVYQCIHYGPIVRSEYASSCGPQFATSLRKDMSRRAVLHPVRIYHYPENSKYILGHRPFADRHIYDMGARYRQAIGVRPQNPGKNVAGFFHETAPT